MLSALFPSVSKITISFLPFSEAEPGYTAFLRAYIPESAEIESVNKRNTLSEAIGIQKCISDFAYFKFKFIECRYTVIVTTVIVYSAKLIFIKWKCEHFKSILSVIVNSYSAENALVLALKPCAKVNSADVLNK